MRPASLPRARAHLFVFFLLLSLLPPTTSFLPPSFLPRSPRSPHSSKLSPSTSLSLTLSEAYTTLDLQPSSPPADVKRAYRKMALKYHPDVNPDTRDKFDDVVEAYK